MEAISNIIFKVVSISVIDNAKELALIAYNFASDIFIISWRIYLRM